MAHYRKKRGFTITELANLSGCTFNNIKAIECRGQKPSAYLAHRLAVALGVRLVGGKRGARESIDLGGFR